eukprot:TRINITY_DN10282_c0_g1_i1.p1 TRINITY_DN10282_c0_g1~~TRINITY_DN10282_c0_g1_i1.p1  ORF type:complete len:168 (+),score=16.23 TRINITY_DN10282_c0_g1_i1:18-521(+)
MQRYRYSKKSTNQDILDTRLDLYSLQIKTQIPGDGNCQFASIADQIYNTHHKHNKVRKQVIKWLKRNEHFQLENGTYLSEYLVKTKHCHTWKQYLKHMKKKGIWGDHLTLIAAAELYRVRIIIISSVDCDVVDVDPITEIVPRSGTWNDVVYLSHLHEFHYCSVLVV